MHCQWLSKHHEDKIPSQATLITNLLKQMQVLRLNSNPKVSQTLFKTTTMNTLIFDGKIEKFELLEDLFQTMLNMQPETSEAIKKKILDRISKKSTTDFEKKWKFQQQTNTCTWRRTHHISTKIRQTSITSHRKSKMA